MSSESQGNKIFLLPKTIIYNYLPKLMLNSITHSIGSQGSSKIGSTAPLSAPFGCDPRGESLTFSIETS
jgi:hypothetical protein